MLGWKTGFFVLLVAAFLGWHVVQRDDRYVDLEGKVHFLNLAAPKHPLWFSIVHSIVAPFAPLLPRLEPELLIRTAQERAQNLTDFGEFGAQMRAGLAVLTDSIQKEANVSPLGKLFLREFMVDLLVAELQLADLVKHFPDILQEPIEAPLIIAGFPRTGTTNMHALLAASEDFRFLPFHQASYPFAAAYDHAPKGSSSNKKNDDASKKGAEKDGGSKPTPKINSMDGVSKQVQRASDALWFLRTAAPLFPMMVNVSAETQVEEIYLEASMFTSMLFETILYLPSYTAWYSAQDHTLVMRHTKLCMQALQYLDRMRSPSPSDFKPRRWLLKSPAHLSRVPNIFEVFPDAKLVITHRDPVPIIKSACVMMSYLARLYSNSPSPANVSRLWIQRVMELVDHLLAHRQTGVLDAHAPAILHMQAEDYWRDNMATVHSIYQLLGQPVGEESARRMQHYVHTHPRQGATAIHYSLDVLGVTEEEILERHGAMRQRYIQTFITPPAPIATSSVEEEPVSSP